MRKVTEKAVQAFVAGRNFSQGNTRVSVVDGHDVALALHGNVIALLDTRTGIVQVNNKGYDTNTTKERLNGVISAFGGDTIYQKNWEWYRDVNGERVAFPYNKWVTL